MIPTIEDIFNLLSQGALSFDEAEMYVSEHIRLAAKNEVKLRDVFAGQALQGRLSRGDSARFTYSELAESAYDMADTMLAVRDE
jgi:hypothetical protein